MRGLVSEGGRAGEAVDDGGVCEREFGDVGEVGGDGGELGGVGEVVYVRAAGDDGSAEEPMAGDAPVHSEELFADAQGVGVDDAVADVVGERADIGGVVVEPFELEEQGA